MISGGVKNRLIIHCMMNQKGITLIELLASMIIIMIVAAPFLGAFINAANNNASSQQVLDSSVFAQKVMEEIKSRPILLKSDSVYVSESAYTDYKVYTNLGDYTAKYKIIKEDGVISSLSQTYEFEKADSIAFDLQFSVDSGFVTFKGFSYDLVSGNNPKSYFLDIYNELNGSLNYKFYSQDNPLLDSGEINSGIEPTRIKVLYLNNSQDEYMLNVNLDGITQSRDVLFYIIDDKKDALSLVNTGKKPFYEYDEISGQYSEYFNTLYKIEVIIEKDSDIINRLVSSVKKIR